jgi:hypothetical protein
VTVSEDSLEPELASVEEPELSVEDELSVEELVPALVVAVEPPSSEPDPPEELFELDADEGVVAGAFRPFVASLLVEAREPFVLLAFGSLVLDVELARVRPWNALAAASVSTPVSTTLPAIIQRFSRRSFRSAASRASLLWIAMRSSLRGPAKERITRL